MINIIYTLDIILSIIQIEYDHQCLNSDYYVINYNCILLYNY